MQYRLYYFLLSFLFLSISCEGKEDSNGTEPPKAPTFNMGVHFNMWFETQNIDQVNFTYYGKQDFLNVKRLGANIVRLPINFKSYTGSSPNYVIEPKLLEYLDQVVAWAEETQTFLIIDNHTLYQDGNAYYYIEPYLIKLWEQLATRYKDKSDFILYEICNEPHDVSDDAWGKIQGNVIKIIRQNDTKHTIIVNPSGWSSYNNLKHLPKYEDDNLMYDFHFYDPMIFTHQASSFITPPTTSLRDVPFPYDASRMPQFPDDMKGTWFETAFSNYEAESSITRLRGLIDIAVAFRDERKVKIFCGELGVHIPGAPPADRVRWYKEICSYLKTNDIPYILWDYKDVFGIFNIDVPGRRWFPDDLNFELVDAIGFEDPRSNK